MSIEQRGENHFGEDQDVPKAFPGAAAALQYQSYPRDKETLSIEFFVTDRVYFTFYTCKSYYIVFIVRLCLLINSNNVRARYKKYFGPVAKRGVTSENNIDMIQCDSVFHILNRMV